LLDEVGQPSIQIALERLCVFQELGVSVTDAAKLAGLDVRQYQKYRNDGVTPQGPQRKRLGEGLGIPAQKLNAAIEELELEPDEAAIEEHLKWVSEQEAQAPATRGDVQKLEAKLLDIEKQLREIRDHLRLSRDAQLEAREEEIQRKLGLSDSPSHAVSDRKSDD
jgi:transcriptional regulator with XRE-family HTH domain